MLGGGSTIPLGVFFCDRIGGYSGLGWVWAGILLWLGILECVSFLFGPDAFLYFYFTLFFTFT
jgi:hypothetical protein